MNVAVPRSVVVGIRGRDGRSVNLVEQGVDFDLCLLVCLSQRCVCRLPSMGRLHYPCFPVPRSRPCFSVLFLAFLAVGSSCIGEQVMICGCECGVDVDVMWMHVVTVAT